MLYRLAAMTGLRVSEPASLTPTSFDLAADPPTVTLEAARLAWLGEAKGNAAETERRTKSRFLCPVVGTPNHHDTGHQCLPSNRHDRRLGRFWLYQWLYPF
ncbi:MAG: hypothetical protein ACKV2Q_10065 [Planctomycetaceae bacterium]